MLHAKMTYPETIKYLESFINYEIIPQYPYNKSLGLERIGGFLKLIGNPQDEIRFIHVAGTKGKGSTCIFAAHILKEAGYSVGLYTSPHLSDFRERIRILPGKSKGEFEGMISKDALKRLVCKLKPRINSYNRNSPYGRLTFFEVYTVLAIKYFQEKKVDFAVLETGLGGRLDATNAVNSILSLITPISYEHTDKLGKTLKEIASQKAGIIKGREACAISAPQEKEAGEVIRARCRNLNVRLYEAGEYNKVKLRLLGRHQLVNAGLAVKAAGALNALGFSISEDAVKRGLSRAMWPGRFEIISRRPYVVLDGAQNAASARALKEAIRDNFSSCGHLGPKWEYKNLILILGICRDKDIKGICAQLYSLADRVILTRAQSLRAFDPEALAGYFKGKEIYITDSVSQARALGMRLASQRDLILVTGSLFVAGEFKYGRKRPD